MSCKLKNWKLEKDNLQVERSRSASWALGSHLGFLASFTKDMIWCSEITRR